MIIGDFAPKLVSLTDGVLFGGIWECPELAPLSSCRRDGTLRPYVTMWVIRASDELYVRSARGPNNPSFRRPSPGGTGRIRAGGLERDVSFAEADPSMHAAIDAAYHTKYDRYGERIVGGVVGSQAHRVTIRRVLKSAQD
jgi:hypothetical protein